MSKESDLQFCKHAVQMELLSRNHAKNRLLDIREIVQQGNDRPPIEVVLLKKGDLTLPQVERVHARMVFEGESPDALALKWVAKNRPQRSELDLSSPPPRPDKKTSNSKSKPSASTPAQKSAPKKTSPQARTADPEMDLVEDRPRKKKSNKQSSPRRSPAANPPLSPREQQNYVIKSKSKAPLIAVTLLLSSIIVICVAMGYYVFSDKDGKGAGGYRFVLSSTQERDTVAAALLSAAKEGSVDKVHELYNWKEFARLSVDDPRITDKEVFYNGMIKQFDTNKQFSEELIVDIQKGHAYTYLRSRKIKGQDLALFRVINNNGDLEYLGLLVGKTSEESKPQVMDVFIASRGEYLSDISERFFVGSQGAIDVGRKDPDKISEGTKKQSAELFQEASMQTALKTNNPQRGLEIYNSLPGDVKVKKIFSRTRLLLEVAAKSKDAFRLVTDHRESYPDDPWLELSLINIYVQQGKIFEALDGVDRLEKIVGGDPYLDVLRANLNVQRENYPEVVQILTRLEGKEEFAKAVLKIRFDLAIVKEDYNEVVSILKNLKAQYNVSLESAIKSDSKYQSFRESDEFKAYSK